MFSRQPDGGEEPGRRAGHQSEGRQDTRPCGAGQAARARRRGDRVSLSTSRLRRNDHERQDCDACHRARCHFHDYDVEAAARIVGQRTAVLAATS
jgi:hypothetical protein